MSFFNELKRRKAIRASIAYIIGAWLLLQLSGLEMTYDLDQRKYSRAVSLTHNGQTVTDDAMYTVAAPGFLTDGGDLYDSFPESEVIRDVGTVSDVIVEYFQSHESRATPKRGRQWQVVK